MGSHHKKIVAGWESSIALTVGSGARLHRTEMEEKMRLVKFTANKREVFINPEMVTKVSPTDYHRTEVFLVGHGGGYSNIVQLDQEYSVVVSALTAKDSNRNEKGQFVSAKGAA